MTRNVDNRHYMIAQVHNSQSVEGLNVKTPEDFRARRT